MSSYIDFKREHSNVFMCGKEYFELTKANKDFYPDYEKPIKKDDIELLTFLGLKVDDCDHFDTKVIPFGDRIVEAFTLGQFVYIKTLSGYFFKELNSSLIRPLPESVYVEKKPYKKEFKCFEKRFPQAGLTRGSKRSFSDRAEPQKNKLLEIQDKYKDGVND